MKKRKIIYIYYRAYDTFFFPKDHEYYYLSGWSQQIASNTLKYAENSYLIENWRPEKEISSPEVTQINGVVCRLFPARYIPHIGYFSASMIRELKKQILDFDVLIYHNTIFNNLFYLLLFMCNRIPVIAQNQGDLPPELRYNENRKIRNRFTQFIEKNALKYVDHFFVLRKRQMEYLAKLLPGYSVSLQTMGVDFEQFKPEDKAISRQKLNLPLHKKIMLYIGRFYSLKGVHCILKAYQELKSYYDLELILIGGSPEDELYNDVKSSGARFYGYLEHNELPAFFSAADVYVLPSFTPNYAGIDVTTLESLACGTPIVSTTLNDFPSDDWRKLGLIPRNEEDLTYCISEIFNNPNHYRECREKAQQYYDWEIITQNTLHIYEKLFNSYYQEI
ncbi:MAG: hypothetical protein A2Y62_16565 [Candidatus Fischerbacteria bacterium RBG_13_37_8]|uniref:Glycosyl transferase family 1 domain-containing protein n=1 Tax=Candidatus Fischerbacteria bacterium RBG_13_37_8 TaxID=1817863 RepID=A0A1F5VNQ1_9BACT|nr:MAG: hypothetical protein A2Y62_16565 [Candidatus Fischerbacteria bacterium RBG_13_37_8]